MDIEQLTHRYARLQQELARAYETLTSHSGAVDRLANDLSETERALAFAQAAAERQQVPTPDRLQ
jgi:chromosome segregation ATPase